MSITEAERHEIYELIKQASNEAVANNVMSLLPPVGWADVATKTDLYAFGAELRAEMAGLRGDMAVMAADLRIEMHQSIRTQTWALVAWTTGWTTALAGFIVALGR